MSVFRVRLHWQAEHDLDEILDWLSRRSSVGAGTWYRRWLEVANNLTDSADKCPLAPENDEAELEIRHLVFKTRRGREYRAIFTIQGDTVVVLHIRGPGQDIVPPEEIREP